MRNYKKGGYNVFHHEFKTLSQFLSYIQNAPVNTYVFNRAIRSSHRRTDDEWYGTGSFEEAVELCLEGWSPGFDQFVRMKKRIDEKLLDPIVRPRQVVADVVGHSPSVPDYLHGNPLNMWNRVNVYTPTFINIYLNISYHCETLFNRVFNRGIIALSLVDALQDRGYGVRFKVFECSTVDKEMIISFFNLKGDGEKLNIKKTYFPLCHPSFLRRLIFQLQEVTPVSKSDWGFSYGCPSDVATIKRVVDIGPNDIIIVQPSEMGVNGENIDEDLEAMLKFTNLEGILAKA